MLHRAQDPADRRTFAGWYADLLQIEREVSDGPSTSGSRVCGLIDQLCRVRVVDQPEESMRQCRNLNAPGQASGVVVGFSRGNEGTAGIRWRPAPDMPIGCSLAAHPRRPVEQAAPLGERGPIRDGAALASPSQMPAARAGDGADPGVSR